jgi:phage terminase small subunit
MSLTNKQRVFIDEYLKDFNATQAALRAGYSQRTAYSIGQENLKKPEIAAVIQQAIDERAMTADELLTRIAEIGRGDLSRYVTNQGEIDLEQLKADGLGHLLKKHKKTRRTIHQKNGDIIETEHQEIELYPADAAHDKLMRYHGLYNDKVKQEIDVSGGITYITENRPNADD